MYSNPKFTERDRALLISFMKAHPFATLIGFDGEYPVLTQVPLLIEERDGIVVLGGHVMRATDHYEAFCRNENVMVLFNGAHSYISASLYEQATVASTWNYSSVQVKGKLKMLDEEETKASIAALTANFEGINSSASFHQMSEDYIKKHLKAISGFEILSVDLVGIFKLSQNHSSQNRNHVINALSNSDDPLARQVAKDMKGLET